MDACTVNDLIRQKLDGHDVSDVEVERLADAIARFSPRGQWAEPEALAAYNELLRRAQPIRRAAREERRDVVANHRPKLTTCKHCGREFRAALEMNGGCPDCFDRCDY